MLCSRRSPPRAWGLAVVLAAASVGRPTAAEARAPASEAPARRAVIVAVAEDDPVLRPPALRSVLRSHFADTGFEPHLEPLPEGDILDHLAWAEGGATGEDAHAVLWVEPGRDGVSRLYLLQPRSGRVWVRVLPMASEPELAAESLGVMARALTRGLDEGEPVGMQEVDIGRPADEATGASPATPTADPPAERPRGLVALGYHGSSVSSDRRWHSGLELRLGLRLPAGLLLGLGGAWAPRVRGRRSAPRAEVRRLAIDLRGGWMFEPHPRLHPQLDASLTAEALGFSVADTPDVDGRRGTAWRVAVAPGAGLTVLVWKTLGLRLHAQADVWLRNADLLVAEGAERRSLVRMHPISGRVDAGVSLRF